MLQRIVVSRGGRFPFTFVGALAIAAAIIATRSRPAQVVSLPVVLVPQRMVPEPLPDLGAARDNIDGCFREWAERIPQLPEAARVFARGNQELILKIEVSRTGIAMVRASGIAVALSAPMKRCVEEAVSRLRFPTRRDAFAVLLEWTESAGIVYQIMARL